MDKRKVVADLHNHTTASDGEYSPSELVAKAKELGLEAIGITDHDTINGLREALDAGRRIGIKVIPGVEVTLRFKNPVFVGSLHLLIYFSETLLEDAVFRDELTGIVGKGRGMSLVEDRVRAINEIFGPDGTDPVLQRPLTSEEIMKHGTNISRRHFFQALSKDHGIEERKTIDRLIGNSSPAYIPSGIDPGLLTEFFKRYKIAKVLSHPAAGSYPGESLYKEVLPPVDVVRDLLPDFLEKQTIGIDGLEVYYPGHTKELRNILLEWAERYGLFVTGGSDCHDRTDRPLGVTGITAEELDVLLNVLENS